jgi:TPR repeat protein
MGAGTVSKVLAATVLIGLAAYVLASNPDVRNHFGWQQPTAPAPIDCGSCTEQTLRGLGFEPVEEWAQQNKELYDLGNGDAAYQRHDYKTAMRIFGLLAERGNYLAQAKLGDMYRDGEGVPQNYAEAAKWYRKAAEYDVYAQTSLGFMYALGEGVPQNYGEAAEWFLKAAMQGDAFAQARLGAMYHSGQGVPQNYARAATWYSLAADDGNADAQSGLAHLYLSGEGVPQDYKEAVRWFRKAADQGLAHAQFMLGFIYRPGPGQEVFGEAVPPNIAEALNWFQRAADQGDALAQSNLGFMYLNGEGLPQDYVRAHKWFNLAAVANSDTKYNIAAENRDKVASKMTPAQIAEAQKLASEWKPKPER